MSNRNTTLVCARTVKFTAQLISCCTWACLSLAQPDPRRGPVRARMELHLISMMGWPDYSTPLSPYQLINLYQINLNP